MDTTVKIFLGIGTAYAVYKILRMGGDQKAARDERAAKRTRSDVADAKAVKRSISDRR